MRAQRLVLCGALASALAGCLRESTIEPIHETVMVHSIALVGRASIGVALATTFTNGVAEPVGNAVVVIRRADTDITLVRSGTASAACFDVELTPVQAQCYAAVLDSPLAPGEVLGLTVELADGTRIAGETTMPAPPIVESPAPGTTAHVEFVQELDDFGGYSLRSPRLEVRWSGTGGHPADVIIAVDSIFDDGVEVDCAGSFFDDAVHSRSPGFVQVPVHCTTSGEDPVWDSAFVTLHVVGYDANARAYIAATDESGAGIVLDGAAPGLEVVEGDMLLSGVFGAAAHATAPIELHATLVTHGSSGSRASGARVRGAAAP